MGISWGFVAYDVQACAFKQKLQILHFCNTLRAGGKITGSVWATESYCH